MSIVQKITIGICPMRENPRHLTPSVETWPKKGRHEAGLNMLSQTEALPTPVV